MLDGAARNRNSETSGAFGLLWGLLVSLGRYSLDFFPHDVFYVRIWRKELHLRVVDGDKEWRDLAAIAVTRSSKRPQVVAVGQSAIEAVALDPDNLELREPFNHPRSIVSDFNAADELLKHGYGKLLSRWQFFSPVVVLHPLEMLEGGLTEIEQRALAELAVHAGARHGCIWTGRELTDEELRAARKCKTLRLKV